MMLPKPKTPRDKKYLAFIRTLPCCDCGLPGPSEAHHIFTGGMALKCSDYDTVPLCRGCHYRADKRKETGEAYKVKVRWFKSIWEARQ